MDYYNIKKALQFAAPSWFLSKLFESVLALEFLNSSASSGELLSSCKERMAR